MDIDLGASFSCLFSLDFYFLVDVPTSSGTVCLLPFSLVPNISLNSPLFSKALATIAKQQKASSISIASSSKGRKQNDPNGDAEYTDHVRQYIVSVFQRLRVTLLVLDNLLEAYHASK